MFGDQEGGMLDYYDLSTERGKKGKRKNQKGTAERNKQKIFKLTEITIPENITSLLISKKIIINLMKIETIKRKQEEIKMKI